LLLSEHFILEAQEMEFPLARMSMFHKFNQNKNVVNFTLHLHYHSAMASETENTPPGVPITHVNFYLHPRQADREWSKITSGVIKQNTTTQEIFHRIHLCVMK
jgi:hypothetical protein